MTIRIHNLEKWQLLPAGQVLVFKDGGRRQIRLRLNCPAPTRVDIVQGEKATFLAVIEGLETLDFSIEGEAEVVCTTDDEVWFHTHEGDETAFDVPDAQSFTRIASRRARNPQLEMMMWKAEQNMKRRLDAQYAEYEQRIAAAGVRHDTATGEVEDEVAGGDVSGEPAGTAKPAIGAAPISDAGPDAGNAVSGGSAAAK